MSQREEKHTEPSSHRAEDPVRADKLSPAMLSSMQNTNNQGKISVDQELPSFSSSPASAMKDLALCHKCLPVHMYTN